MQLRNVRVMTCAPMLLCSHAHLCSHVPSLTNAAKKRADHDLCSHAPLLPCVGNKNMCSYAPGVMARPSVEEPECVPYAPGATARLPLDVPNLKTILLANNCHT
eukprot:86159-Pelagomonas_calceolata.AAC.1